MHFHQQGAARLVATFGEIWAISPAYFETLSHAIGEDGELPTPVECVARRAASQRGGKATSILPLRGIITPALCAGFAEAFAQQLANPQIGQIVIDIDSPGGVVYGTRWDDMGDDPRLVDWKAFARRGYPVVRDFQEERGQELIVVVDGGRRMGAGTAGTQGTEWTKLDYALDAGLELAAVALQAGDRVGFAVFDRRLRVYIPAIKGARQLGRIKRAVFAELPSSVL